MELHRQTTAFHEIVAIIVRDVLSSWRSVLPRRCVEGNAFDTGGGPSGPPAPSPERRHAARNRPDGLVAFHVISAQAEIHATIALQDRDFRGSPPPRG